VARPEPQMWRDRLACAAAGKGNGEALWTGIDPVRDSGGEPGQPSALCGMAGDGRH